MAAEQTELIIGLVSAVGTDTDLVADEIETELTDYGYKSHMLRLSDYLAELDGVEDFRARPYDERVWAGMDAGTKLREDWERGDALALWAISDIVAEREAQTEERVPLWPGENAPQVPATLQRQAFILRSLKNRAELQTLRTVYGSRFFLIAAYSPDDNRRATLEEKIQRDRKNKDKETWSHQPEELMKRDLDEQRAGGQDVVGTFYQADLFVDASDSETLRADVIRTLRIIFGDPFRTPTRDEHAQFMAAGAALRSAELGRQVGAAIADKAGSILAVGANEVPQVGGGSHWEGDPEADDNREFRHSSRDTNRVHQERIADDLAGALERRLGDLIVAREDPANRDVMDAVRNDFAEDLREMLLRESLGEITEYGRAVHAEMNAILDAVRRGVPVAGTTLHSTTFPCHNCARHLIGAGVERVVFVEPYEKSRARELHEEAVVIAQSTKDGKVAFEPFVGVAPRRYRELFNASWRERNGYQARKAKDGTVAQFDKRAARPVFADLEYPPELRPDLPPYRTRELTALSDFEELSERTTQGSAPELGVAPPECMTEQTEISPEGTEEPHGGSERA